MQGEISTVVKQISGLLLLAGCAYLSTPSPKPKVNIFPAVTADSPARQKQRNYISPEVQEFLRLPPPIQRQVLDYARNWIDANFERVN